MEQRLIQADKQVGFSLVEVALALGVMAFAMLPILALVPVALDINRQSIERNIEARMLGSLRAELAKAAFSEINSGFPPVVFDEDGGRIEAGSPGALPRYRVEWTPAPSTALPGNQAATKLKAVGYEIRNLVQGGVRTGTIHVSDNGF